MEKSLLPPIPPQPAHPGFVLFGPSPAQLSWIGETIYAALEILAKKENTIMATIEELQAALDANTAATTAAGAAIASEITDLAAAIAALVPGDPVTQAQLDQLNAATASLTAATAALAADDVAPAA